MVFEKNKPIYLQLIRLIEDKIVDGSYPAASELPSRREVARHFGVNPNTVQRAFSELEKAGLIHTRPNVPSTVTEDQDRIQSLRQERLEEAIEDFVDRVRPLHIDDQDLLQLIEAQLIRRKKE